MSEGRHSGGAFDPTVPVPRQAFREDLRARFVAGALAGAQAGATGPESESQSEGSVRTAHRMVPSSDFYDDLDQRHLAKEPAPMARTRFRQTLRNQFTSGVITGEPDQLPRHANRGRDRRDGGSSEPPRGLVHPFLRPLVLVAGVALAFFLGNRFLGSEDPDQGAGTWGVTHATRIAGIEVDGVRFDTADLESLGTRLAMADTVSFGDSEVELALDEGVHVSILPGTVLERMPFQTRQSGEPLELHLTDGEVFLRTTKGTGPHDIRIHTAHAEVRVLGTTLGVMCHDEVTCVCVADGMVKVLLGEDPVPRMVMAKNSLRLVAGQEERVPHFGPNEVEPAMQAHFEELQAYFKFGTRLR